MQDSVTITRQSASNLALSFIALGREKRKAMAVLYAFCREVDDVADEDSRSVEERRDNLKYWRDDVRRACEGDEPKKALNKELKPVAEGPHDMISPSLAKLSSRLALVPSSCRRNSRMRGNFSIARSICGLEPGA